MCEIAVSRLKDYVSYDAACKTAKCLAPDWQKRLLEEYESEAPVEGWPLKLLDNDSRLMVWATAESIGVPPITGIAAQSCRLLEKYLWTKIKQKLTSLADEIGNDYIFMQHWRQYKQELMNRMPLLIASSIQLVTKYNGGRHIPTSKVCSVLSGMGVHYTPTEVTAAEFKVFRTLGFRVPLWTSLEVAEMLAHEVGLTEKNPGRNYRVLAFVVDITEFSRNNIEYDARWIANVECKDGAQIRTLHLCASAVVAMSRLVNENSEAAVERLRVITRAPMLLISCVADIIITTVLETDTKHVLRAIMNTST